MAQVKKRITATGEDRWDVRTRIGGRVVTRSFRTKREANAYAATIEADKLRGAAVDPRAGRLSLRDYATRWMLVRTDLRPTTRANYENLLGRHILPALGELELGAIDTEAVRGWHLELRSRHTSTADDAYRLLRAMLNTALEDGRVVVNPCRVKGAGTVSAAERPTATVAELQAAIDASPPRFRLAFALAAWCQLRRAEVLGLQRGDIDLLHSELRVVRTVTSPYKSRGVVIGPPKTDAGARTLAIGGNVIPLVVDHLERHVGPDSGAWVFATESGGPISPRYLSRVVQSSRGRGAPRSSPP